MSGAWGEEGDHGSFIINCVRVGKKYELRFGGEE